MKAIGHESNANILVTQPRRVAATSLAMRVSNERSSPSPGKPGSIVGYNVRLSKTTTETTKITYCTVGILLRMLVNPKENEDLNDHYNKDVKEDHDTTTKPLNVPLSEISHIIIDEVHERDLNTDFALTLLRPLLRDNKHISILLMSATASSELFVNYFRSERLNIEPKVFRIPGRTFPVEMKWLPECETLVSGRLHGWKNDHRPGNERTDDIDKHDEVILSPRATAKIDNEFIAKLIKKLATDQWNADGKAKWTDKTIQSKENGAILVFLPGKGELNTLAKTLYKDPDLGNKNRCSIIHLHSLLPPS